MPKEGFEITIPVFERAKTFHALDRTASVIGEAYFLSPQFIPPVNNRLTSKPAVRTDMHQANSTIRVLF
jgi:hypothetical protein